MYIYQTMSNNFGYLDIILLAMIAGFIILRLRNVLGRKTGHQDKVYSEFSKKKFEQFKNLAEAKAKKSPTEFDLNEKKQFLKGAEIAYETILTSFSKGDKEGLKSLLTEKMQANFSSAIEDRKSKKIKSELTFVGVKSSAIQKFEKTAEALFFTVKFVSEIISAKKNQDNKIVEGDPNKIKTVIDHWKFTKKISSVNPNWYLAEIKNP
jgi:predicted lipid-binding transport protein (Tim44 family)